MADSILRTKSKEFSKAVIILCRSLKENNVEYALINQLLRSGTSVGANIHEAQYAQGIKDFISKFEIALKECNESEYWLELLFDVDSIPKEDFKLLQKECIELRRMLVSSRQIITIKRNCSKMILLQHLLFYIQFNILSVRGYAIVKSVHSCFALPLYG